MSEMAEIVERGERVLVGNYARQRVVMARGEGPYVWDARGERYIDLFAGFGSAVLGHCHPALVEAATAQAAKLWHVGNTFYTEAQVDVAERMNRHAFAGQAFFCQSGLEANEAACKLARLRGREHSPRRWKIISLHRSFHGRSLAMIAATGSAKIKAGFEPEVPGFTQVEPGDIDALAAAVDADTAGVMIEPIQGEGGVNLYPPDYPARVRELCDRHGLTLIFDEVWTGMGRTGRWFAHQHFTRPDGGAVEPDVMTLGKAVGGGLPVGVMYAKPEIARLLVPSTHGSTLGGNAICMAATRAIFDVIEKEGLVDGAASLGQYAVHRLQSESRLAAKVAEVRGKGIMLGIELKAPAEKVVEKGLEHGVVMNVTAQKVIRLAPPINIPRRVWEEGLDRVVETIASI